MARHAQWSAIYADLARAGGDRIGFGDYTDEAYAVFPRYNVLQAVLDEIEALNADDLPAFDMLRNLIVKAAETASSEFTRPIANDIHHRAMAEERACLASTFRSMAEPELDEVEPLFYRRSLSPDEVQAWRRVIKEAWGATDGYWYPLAEKSHPSLIALELSGIDQVALQERMRRFLAENGVHRVIELREHGTSYEVQSDSVEMLYNLAEGFWTSALSEWIVYCSHEGTITFGGRIAFAIGPEYPASRIEPGQPPHWRASRQ
jgi:hypothetical protein